jgi:hypothetical protein
MIGLLTLHSPTLITVIKLGKFYSQSPPFFLCQNQHKNSVLNNALVDLVFLNINDFRVSVSDCPIVASDNIHATFNLDFISLIVIIGVLPSFFDLIMFKERVCSFRIFYLIVTCS